MKNKKIIITLSIIAILVLTIGITYSIFTTSKTSKNSNLVVGDIYMHYNETNQIQMENAMPTSLYIVNPIMATQEYTKGGKNELSKCVDSFVNLSAPSELATTICKGGSIDNYLTLQQMYEEGNLDEMNLTDTFMQENILTINSTLPYFEFTVDGKNTTTDKDIWYEVVLSKGDDLEGKSRIKDNLLKFTLTEAKDNKETILVNNKSYDDLTSKRIWVDTINKNTTSEVVHTYRLYMWISNDTVIGNVNQDYTIEEWKDIFASIKVNVAGDFEEKVLTTDESCFTAGTVKTYQVNNNMTDEELNKCTTYITNLGWDWNNGETSEAFCKGTGTNQGITFEKILNLSEYGFNSEQLSYFESNNIIAFNVGVAIVDYDATCGTDVIIPSTISGYPVKVIGNKATTIIKQLSNKNNNYSFNNLNNYVNKKYKINKIGTSLGAFQNKNLTSVIIPNTVTTIEDSAFANNQLTNVNFSNSSTLKSIFYSAFANNNIKAITVPDSVSFLACNAFDDTVAITKSDSLTCVPVLAE